MSRYELLSTLVALFALALSAVSLVRTRKTAELQTELARLSAELAGRQLDRLVADEPLEDQPRFAVRPIAISGLGDPATDSYEVRIKLKIDNAGDSYLESQCVSLVTLQGGVYRNCPKAWIEFADRRNGFAIEGEHTLIIKRGADLLACSLHVQYIDRLGKNKTQEFRVIPEGGSEYLPSTVFFHLGRVSTIVPGSVWSLK